METAYSEKVALITGASSGIGAGTAVLLASKGYQLALTGRDVEALQKVAQQCQEKGLDKDKVLLIPGDLVKEEDVRKVVETTVKHFNRIDVLINNAGILIEKNFEESTLEDYDRIMSINLRAVVHITKLCVPHLIKSKGNIINVSSIASTISFHQIIFYGMTKAALDQFTKSLASELGPKGVRVNSVSPGTVKTEVHFRAGQTKEGYEKYLNKMREIYPARRVGEVEDVANAIAYLISDEASFIMGAILIVDGGRHVVQPR